MPNVALYNIAGEEIGKVKLSEEIFGHEVNEAVLHTVVTAYLANQRQGLPRKRKQEGKARRHEERPLQQGKRQRHRSFRCP